MTTENTTAAALAELLNTLAYEMYETRTSGETSSTARKWLEVEETLAIARDLDTIEEVLAQLGDARSTAYELRRRGRAAAEAQMVGRS